MKTKAIMLVTLIFIALIVASVWHTKSQNVMAGVREAAVAEIAATTGASVQFGDIEAVSLNRVVVHDVSIYDKEAKLIASSPKVSVGINLLSLLFGQRVDMITAIEVDRPMLFLVQKAGGRWNFEDVIAENKTTQSSFGGKVSFKDGRAEIKAVAGQWNLTDVNGSLDFASRLATDIHLSAVYHESPIEVSGSMNPDGDGVVSVKARGVVLNDFAALLPQQSAIRLIDGTAATLEATVKKTGDEMTYAGQTELHDASADINGLEVRGVNGLVTFTNERVYIFAKAQVAGQPVAVKGKIAVNTGLPVLDLNVSSEGFDLLALKADLPVKGLVSFDATVRGMTNSLAIEGDFSLPQGNVGGLDVKNLSAKLHLADNILTINEGKGGIAGGQLAASGVINLTANQYELRIKGSHIDSSALGDYLPDVSGIADIDVVAAGSGADIAGATIYGTANMSGGSYKGVAFNSISSSFYLANAELTLDYFNIGLENGSATVSGTASQDSVKLNVRGQKIPLSLLAANGNGINVDGEADFTGTITGTVQQPALTLDFKAVNGQAFYQPFTYAQGKVQITPAIVTLTDIQLADGPTTHNIAGTIGINDDRQINLAIHSHQARAENIVKLIAPDEKLTGNVDNDVILTGPLNNFNAKGHLRLTEGSFRGHLIAGAEGFYQRENGLTQINNFVINSLNTQIKIAGVVQQDQELNLTIDAQNLDIDRLRLNLPYPLAGRANFTGKLTGTPSAPIFSGQLSADSLLFKDQEIRQVRGELALIGDRIDIPQFHFLQGGGTYNFSGGLDLASGTVYGGVDVEKGELAALLSILNIPAKEVSGQMNGHIVISGTTSRPNISLTGNIENGKVKNYLLDNVEIDAALENNVVTVNQFLAKQGKGILAVHGTANLSGPLDFEAGGRDIDAGLLSALFDSKVDVKGKLNFAAQVSGTAANPHADVSLEIAGGGVGTTTFDSLYGLFILSDHRINMNQLLLTKGPYKASAYGVIPVAALSSEGRRQATQADQMDVKVRLDQANLSILPLLTNEVAWASGATQGELNITGTVAEPYLSGNVSVKDGTLKLAKLNDPIQKVALDIQFKGDKIVLKTFSGHMGSGSYQMTGDATLSGLALSDYNFQLTLDKLGVSSKYFKGPLSGNLALTTKKGRPMLAGKLLFEHDTIDIPFITDFTQSDLNVGLDIELIAGDKVRFYNSYMYDIWAEGRVKFIGSTKHPNPAGQITAIRGTVSYLRTQFKIKEGSAEFIQFGTFEPILRLKASTQLHDTTVNLSINGPVSTMDMQLTAEPAMRQEEIISLLTLRSHYFDKQNGGNSGASGSGFGRDEVVSLLDAGLQMRFVSEVENIFRDAFGLDDFRVVRDTLWGNTHQKASEDQEGSVNREVYNIEMGKYVTDRLMLNYTMGLDYSQHSFGFRYDLNRKISLTGSVDNQNDRRIGIETRFRF